MEKFTLYINTDTSAFDDDPRYEIARILENVAASLNRGEVYDVFQTIFDYNGNDVGRYALKEG